MASYGDPDNTRNSVTKIRILVVDDATACLNIVAAILKGFKHEVVTAIHGVDALNKLERSQGQFDLVVTGYYMPYMNGLELQERIQEEYGLPVIIMSADDTECVMVKCLEQGAVFFLVKPIRPEALKNIWQYAVKGRKGISIATEIVPRAVACGRPLRIADTAANCDPHYKEHYQEQYATSYAQSRNIVIQDRIHSETNPHKPGEKRQSGVAKKKDKGQSSGMVKPKRPYASPRKKINWTTELHALFLLAVKIIGIERVQPKKILDVMKMPDLTRQTIASHLQKYRIYLKEKQQEADALRASATPVGLLPMVAREPDVTAVDIDNSHPFPALQPDDRSYSTHDYSKSHHGKNPLNDQTLYNYGSHDRPIALWPRSNNRLASWKKTTTDGSQSIGTVLESGAATMYHQSQGASQRSPVNPISFGSGSSSAQSQLGDPRQINEQQQSLVAPKRFASRLLGYGEAASMSNIDSIIGGSGTFSNYVAPPPSPLKPNNNNSYAGIQLSCTGNSLIRQTQPNSVVGAAENNRANYIYGLASMSGTPHIGTSSLTGPCIGKFSTSTGPGTFSTLGGSSNTTFWLGSTSEGVPGANDQNPIHDPPIEVENPFALEELIKTVLGETDGSPIHPIPGEGCSNEFSSSAVPVHGKTPILDVENAFCQVQPIPTRGSSRGANSSAWNEPSHEQHLIFHGNPKGKEIAQIPADFFPDFDDPIPNQVHSISVGQGSGTNPIAATNTNTMQPIGNFISTASEKELVDDFIDSLLNDFDEVGPSQ